MATDQWFYRIEGNNNVIFSDINNNRILRLPKIRNRNRLSSSVQAKTDVGREVEFLEHVVSKIFKDVRVRLVVGKKIHVSKEFLEKLSKEMTGKRPVQYENEKLDDSIDYGLLLPNLCKLRLKKSSAINRSSFLSNNVSTVPTISVELRPKSCYIPDFEIETCSEIKDKCFFCLRRIFESIKHPDTLQTKYCPNDLYSGNSIRFKRAIRDLISCPQRCFSVRIDDQDVFSNALLERKSSESKISNLKKFNRFTFDQTVSSQFGENGKEAFLNVLCNVLQTSVVANKDISYFQQNLCPPKQHCRRKLLKECPDVEDNSTEVRKNPSVLALLSSIHAQRNLPLRKLVRLHGEVRSHLKDHEEDADVLSLDPPYNVRSWKNAIRIRRKSNSELANTQQKASGQSDIVEAAETLRRFMIARGFGCCSLIITLQELEQGDCGSSHFDRNDATLVTDDFGRTYVSSISIIDLYKDLLPAQVEKSYRREQEMVTFLNNHFEKESARAVYDTIRSFF